MSPEYRQTASFLEDANCFLAKQRTDFNELLKEGMDLFGVSARKLSKDLGILSFTVDSWANKKSLPLPLVQRKIIEKLTRYAPQYEVHYGIVWCKITDNGRVSYRHDRWMIAYQDKGCWSLSGETSWALWDTANGLVMESQTASLLFACARELVLECAAETISQFQYEVG